MSFWKHLRAILLLPAVVTVIIPGVILYQSRTIRVGWSLPFPWGLAPVMLGFMFLGFGMLLMAETIQLFVRRGQGTLAPWDPPQNLVVEGIYRHVRNPMISGVFAILLGEAAALGSRPLLYWFLTFVILNLAFIPLVEEPALVRRFGEDYHRYKRNVPRWLPRLRPWVAPGRQTDRR